MQISKIKNNKILSYTKSTSNKAKQRNCYSSSYGKMFDKSASKALCSLCFSKIQFTGVKDEHIKTAKVLRIKANDIQKTVQSNIKNQAQAKLQRAKIIYSDPYTQNKTEKTIDRTIESRLKEGKGEVTVVKENEHSGFYPISSIIYENNASDITYEECVYDINQGIAKDSYIFKNDKLCSYTRNQYAGKFKTIDTLFDKDGSLNFYYQEAFLGDKSVILYFVDSELRQAFVEEEPLKNTYMVYEYDNNHCRAYKNTSLSINDCLSCDDAYEFDI